MLAERHRLLRIFVAALAPLCATSCAIDLEQFDFDACNEHGRFTALGTISPVTAVDYLVLRRRTGEYDGRDEGWYSSGEHGEPCGGASAPTVCEAALDGLPWESEFLSTDDIYNIAPIQLAYTRGDEVGAITDEATLREFLGEINSPAEAALLRQLTSRDLHCIAGDEVGEDPEGYLVYTQNGGVLGCSDTTQRVVLIRGDGSDEVIDEHVVSRVPRNTICQGGRLPPGLCSRAQTPASTPLGSYLASMAHLEAASVPAFAQLAGELRRFAAPPALARGALRSRADETRHARLIAHLARCRGGHPTRPQLRPTPPRRFTDVVEDNAIEGCIRETYGAMLAHLQARRAADPELRRAFAHIAVDETRHAALSWAIHRWAERRLQPRERRRLARRRRAAAERLRVDLTRAFDPSVHRAAGLPTPDEGRALFDRLHRGLAYSLS